MLFNCFLELQQLFSLCIYILRVWACFLQSGLSFLEKKVWPSRLTLHTWREHSGHSSHSTQWTHKQSQAEPEHTLTEHTKQVSCQVPPRTLQKLVSLLLSGNHNHGSPSQTDCSNLTQLKRLKRHIRDNLTISCFFSNPLVSWLLLSTQLKN